MVNMVVLPSIFTQMYHTMKLNTPCQAVAAGVFLSSTSQTLNHQLLSTLYLGDIPYTLVIRLIPWYLVILMPIASNGKCLHRFERTIIEAFLSDYNMNINDGSPTRIADNSETAFDLSLCSPSISFNFDWSVFKSPLDSDHCPVIIETQDSPHEPPIYHHGT